MNPPRRRRSERDMIALGGWIFADLLLGLAMLFFTANTVGQPPPTPTPLPTPNLLATERARSGQALALTGATATAAAISAEGTAAALSSAVASGDSALATAAARATLEALRLQQGTQTAVAEQTRTAMSADARATADAQSTAAALAAQATIAAFATARALDAAGIDQLIAQGATAEARSVESAATAAAVATRAAEIEAVATARALEGDGALAAALATNEALIVSGQLGQIDLATAQAQSTEIAATVIALQQQQADLQVTATALARAALAGSLNPDARTVTIQVNLDRFLNNRSDAFEDAANQLSGSLAPYRVPDCRVGFVLIGGYAPELGAGIQLAEGIEGILFGQFPDLFTAGQTGVQRFWNPGDPGSNGTVELEMFFYNGCTG
ncbi:MAG: hypothetical protein ACKOWF_11260 [Chloroflexota bacterium]